MAASFNFPVIDGSPGNILRVYGKDLVGGGSAQVTLSNQGVSSIPGLTPQTITLVSKFDPNGNYVDVTIPDGANDGVLAVESEDTTTASTNLRVQSQYIQSYEYVGEGENIASLTPPLAPGELDAIIRRASAMCDAFMNGGIRYLQVKENPRYKARPNGAPLLFPFRTRGRRVPIVSVDQLTFISAESLVTVFNTSDMYINSDLNYIEVLAYAVGNYALVGQLQIIGYSANVFELSYTSGYKCAQYPNQIREATILTTTMLLNRRRRQAMGLGPFASFEDKLKIDKDAVRLPKDAMGLLVPYVANTVA